MQASRERVFGNLIWRFAERCGAQLVTFVVSLVLARMLEPQIYGTVALITVFTTILQVFVDSGLGNALIQKKDADQKDFSTVFYCNIAFCLVLYVLMYISAPVIADFYGDADLIPLIRVLSITIVISGIKNVQQAYVSRNLLFKKFFFSTLSGTLVAAVVGIYMAYTGFVVWALVAQQITNVDIDTLILWVSVKWRPSFQFSFSRLKGLFNYGSRLLFSALLDTVYKNLNQLIIGKLYSSSDLAFYNRGKQFPDVFINNVNSSIDSVILPVMSKAQDDTESIKNMLRRSIKVSIYIIAPFMIGLAVVAPAFVKLILTETWLPCVPFLRVFCITGMFYPIHTANLNALKALGRSDIFLKLEIQKKVIDLTVLLIVMWFGVEAILYSQLLLSIISQLINTAPNKKILNYGYMNQLKDILPAIGLALGMGAVVSFVPLLQLSTGATLLLQMLVGAIVYVAGSYVFKIDSFTYLLEIVDKRKK